VTRPVNYYRMKPSQPRERPSWWTPENVLTQLQSGQRAVDVAMKAHEEMGTALALRSFRKDISAWANSASWGDQFKAAFKLARTNSVSHDVEITKEWHDDFLDELERQGGKIPEACEAQGIGVDLVYALRDKRNKCYDAEFDERVRVVENLRLSKIRENLFKQAEADTADGGKLAAKVLESHMPSLHGQKTHLEVSGGLRNTVEHHIIPPEVVAASQARTRVLLANRQRPALEAGRGPENVIDVVPVAAKAARG
jgi:hypothetical protein